MTARRDDLRRHPVLLATVVKCAVDVFDQIVGMFDQAVSGTENRARRKLDDLLASRARSWPNDGAGSTPGCSRTSPRW